MIDEMDEFLAAAVPAILQLITGSPSHTPADNWSCSYVLDV